MPSILHHMKLIGLLFLFALTGCAELLPPKYVPPTGAETASFTIDLGEATWSQYMRLQVYAYGEASTCSHKSEIADLFTGRNETKFSTRIPAGKEFAFTLVPAVLNKYSVMHFSFEPKIGADYIAVVRCNYRDGGCATVILETRPDGSRLTVENVARLKHNELPFNDRNYCSKA